MALQSNGWLNSIARMGCSLATFGHVLANCGHFQATSGHFWPLLATSGHFGKLGNFVATASGEAWQAGSKNSVFFDCSPSGHRRACRAWPTRRSDPALRSDPGRRQHSGANLCVYESIVRLSPGWRFARIRFLFLAGADGFCRPGLRAPAVARTGAQNRIFKEQATATRRYSS
jgi:hypothetical protein